MFLIRKVIAFSTKNSLNSVPENLPSNKSFEKHFYKTELPMRKANLWLENNQR